MNIMSILSALVGWFSIYRYPVLYPLAIVEGPVLMMISGFLVRTGFFAFWPAYFYLMAGDLTGDVFWYLMGRHAARPLIRRFGKYLSIDEAAFAKFEQKFHEHQGKILFISKITMGFGFALATLMAAGAAKVPFKKYFAINFGGQFIWTGILMAVGYFLGNLYGLVNQSLHWAFIVALILLGFLAMWGFGKAMKKKFSM